MSETAWEYITDARQLLSSGCYSKAFDLYILAFEKDDELKTLLEQEFHAILMTLHEVLDNDNKFEDIFANFGRAINVFPNNVHLLNDTGKYLYKFGFYQEAWCHFQTALRFDNSFVNAEKNLNSVKNLLMERWHFRMLNDKIRNDAYRTAIRDTVAPFNDTVLDIGTGTGLLALYASEYSPRAVSGCDGSDVMTGLAESITVDNHRPEITIINKMSTAMTSSDINGTRSLIITEMFDAGLFGEHILQTLANAWENLMSENAKVLPMKAEFFVVAADCQFLKLKYQLQSSVKALLDIPHLVVHNDSIIDTYDSEDVHAYKDIKYLTESQSLLKVNFNDYQDIQATLNRVDPYNVQLKAMESGEVNIIIGWFNLHLTDDITLTTDPREKNRAAAWQQAVFFDNIPKSVKEDEVLDVNFLMNGGKLTMVSNTDNEIVRISPEGLRFLNDTVFINMISGSIAMTCIYLGQMADVTLMNIVDLCPFPLFGLLMLKRGAQSVTCCAKTDSDRSFFERVFNTNKIPLSKINILMGDDWGREVFGDEKYHAIFSSVIDLWGDIDLHNRGITEYLKESHLLQGGLFMPSKINVVAQVVTCQWLDINNRVYDENMHHYKIAKHVNKYQVSQNYCIDFSHLDYTPLTEPAVLGTIENETRSHVVQIPVINTGYANGILCWYNFELMDNLGEISTNRSNSFADGIIFLVYPRVRIVRGRAVGVKRCIDKDGGFKLMIDGEAT